MMLRPDSSISLLEHQEIAAFRSYLQSLKDSQGQIPDVSGSVGVSSLDKSAEVQDGDTGTATTGVLNGLATEDILQNAAVALFSMPDNLAEALECLIVFLLALALIYTIASILAGGPTVNEIEKMNMRRRKLLWSSIGLLIAIALSALFAYFCTILPFVIMFLVVMGMILFSNKGVVREVNQSRNEVIAMGPATPVTRESYEKSLEDLASTTREESQNKSEEDIERKKGFKGIIGE